MKDIQKYIVGGLSVAVIVLFIWNLCLNSKINRLETNNAVIYNKKSKSPDEMFDKFFDLVIKLKELEQEQKDNE